MPCQFPRFLRVYKPVSSDRLSTWHPFFSVYAPLTGSNSEPQIRFNAAAYSDIGLLTQSAPRKRH